MVEVIEEVEVKSVYVQYFIEEVCGIWDKWDIQEDKEVDGFFKFYFFYNGFMVFYFGCFVCWDMLKVLKVINMDKDGYIDWYEFLVYLKWVMYQYFNIKDVDEFLFVVFCKGIILVMQDELFWKLFKRIKKSC